MSSISPSGNSNYNSYQPKAPLLSVVPAPEFDSSSSSSGRKPIPEAVPVSAFDTDPVDPTPLTEYNPALYKNSKSSGTSETSSSDNSGNPLTDGKTVDSPIWDVRLYTLDEDGEYRWTNPETGSEHQFSPSTGRTYLTNDGLYANGVKLESQTADFNAGGGVKQFTSYDTGKTIQYTEYTRNDTGPTSDGPVEIVRDVVLPH